MTTMNVTQRFLEIHPGARAGLLIMRGVENPAQDAHLEERKRELEQSLRERFAGMEENEVERIHPFSVYASYYRKFDKTYHVAGQMKSVVFKQKSLPSVAALVEAMFMAELKNGYLTAGHDLDLLEFPLQLDAATGDESYTLLRGSEQKLKAVDMFIRDGQGILSSVIYGPDQRSQIVTETKNVAFTVYAPGGIPGLEIERHLEEIRDLVMIFAPASRVDELRVYGGDLP